MASPPQATQNEPSASAGADKPKDDGRPGQSGRGSVNQATAAGIKPLDKTKFGAPITETTTTPLTTVMKAPGQYNEKTIRTEGMV